jgi:gliding motility-associated-like protein
MNNYQYRCSVRNDCNSVSSSAATLTVISLIPSVHIAISSNSICPGTPVDFTATPTDGGAAPSFQWQINGNNTGTNSPEFITGSLIDGDVVSCVLTSSLECASPVRAARDISVTVHPNPVVILGPDTAIFYGNSLALNARVAGTIANYQWTPADGLSDPFIADPIASPPDSITYHLTVTSTDGCHGYGKITISLLRELLMPNAFTPNGDGKNDVFRIPAHVQLALEDFSVYDRWGNAVFRTNDISKGWDGIYGGSHAETGTYVYMIRGSFRGKRIFLKGTVVLVR